MFSNCTCVNAEVLKKRTEEVNASGFNSNRLNTATRKASLVTFRLKKYIYIYTFYIYIFLYLAEFFFSP